MDLSLDDDMLSLIVSGVLHGEDIAKRYPDFYRRLLQEASLREAFLDALQSLDAEQNGQLAPPPNDSPPDLDFLSAPQPTAGGAVQPVLEQLGIDRWRARWVETIAELQAVFAPPRLALRADPALDDDWFRLLRGEVRVAGVLYTLALESTLTENEQNPALQTSLALAVTLETSLEDTHPAFPVHAALDWGEYHGSLQIEHEGRLHFPDIPLAAIFDPDLERVRSDLHLTIEAPG